MNYIKKFQKMNRYQQIFTHTSFGIIDEDWTATIPLIQKLKEKNIENIKEYLDKNEDVVKEIANSIIISNFNKKIMEMYEVNEKTQLYESILNTFCEESYKCFKKEIIAIYNGDDEFCDEIKTKTYKNNDLYTMITIKIPTKEKNFKHVIITMIDITENIESKREYKENFNENLEKYKQILKSTNAIYLILNENFEIKEYCDYFSKLFGNYDFENKNLEDFVTKDYKEKLKKIKKELNQGNVISSQEISFIVKDKRAWFDINAGMIKNGKCNIFMLLNNITSKKNEEIEKFIKKEKAKDALRYKILNLRKSILKIRESSD